MNLHKIVETLHRNGWRGAGAHQQFQAARQVEREVMKRGHAYIAIAPDGVTLDAFPSIGEAQRAPGHFILFARGPK